ncbi:hypothetical protein [Halalkalicoccus jeotgali]|uniref:Uncharacterized protein n=1 Tax=Halalkalicoccus jeotgali (strain DSM 18796 / CECT 7217 / JCM 14584 / KCTC 4019 / B3) TaxID=795797 RepID=D8JA73_HALJB|nr:hypothetical protein [Halalkalicoccus jeotgali]ADJ14595.1 hypothetical protein HacjB3_06020 [Halalkalicoccus jeotgali B3]ELY39968.1 hypothetical protein C497_04407 [Halalkalicoccus jeotgali B3]
MSSTPQPHRPATESPRTTPIERNREPTAGAPATFDTGCRRRLGCLIDDENLGVSPAFSADRD